MNFWEIIRKSKKFSIRFSLLHEKSAFIDVFLLVKLILSEKSLARTSVMVAFPSAFAP